MAFVKEIPSPEVRERYGPLPNLYEGRLWVADYEREIFLWGGQDGNPYFDDLIEGLFRMRYGGQLFRFGLYCYEWRLPTEDGRHVLKWDRIGGLIQLPRELVLALRMFCAQSRMRLSCLIRMRYPWVSRRT